MVKSKVFISFLSTIIVSVILMINLHIYSSTTTKISITKLDKTLHHPRFASFNRKSTHHSDASYHKRYPVNCSAIFRGNGIHLRKVDSMLREHKCFSDCNNDKAFLVPSDCEVATTWLRNCDTFKMSRGYPSHALSKEEEMFPIAYAISVYKDSAQVERVLRAIYQPQNIYCIHADLKSSSAFHRAIKRLADCFENVFVASKLERVQWGSISVVKADLHCMNDLLRNPVQWKYYINLCGQDFPLKTNLEIVRQLKAYNGRNCVTGMPIQGSVFEYRIKPEIKGAPPIAIYKGETYIAATRQFVDFVFNSKIAKIFVSWLNDTLVPDESYTLSLHRLLLAPGGYTGKANLDNESNVRYRRWRDHEWKPNCRGKYVREICIFSSNDLQFLWKRPELFVNKFHYDYDPVTMQCMEELLEYRTRHPEELRNQIEYFPIRNYSWQTETDHPL